MKFLEISDGFSIALSKIEAIERSGEGSKVFTIGRVFESTFPFNALLQLIEREHESEIENAENSTQILREMFKHSQSFAG